MDYASSWDFTLANFNVYCNIAKYCFRRLAPNLRQIGDCRKIENPETVAVSGFLKFDMRDRLSLGELGSATCGLQTVLHDFLVGKTIAITCFFALAIGFNPTLNPGSSVLI